MAGTSASAHPTQLPGSRAKYMAYNETETNGASVLFHLHGPPLFPLLDLFFPQTRVLVVLQPFWPALLVGNELAPKAGYVCAKN